MSENNFLQSIIDTEAVAEEIVLEASAEAAEIVDKARNRASSIGDNSSELLLDNKRQAQEESTQKAQALRDEILDQARLDAEEEKETYRQNLDELAGRTSERILDIIGHS